MNNKTRKISIVSCETRCEFDSYNDPFSSTHFVDIITDWQEVTEEEYVLLKRYLPLIASDKSYVIVEKPDVSVKDLLKDISKFVKEQAEISANRKKIEEEKRLQKQKIKDDKDKERKRKLFKELREQLGYDVDIEVI